MQKAKEWIQERTYCLDDSESNERDAEHMAQLKPDINNLVHMYMPGDTTITEAAIIAECIHLMIIDPKRFLEK